MIVISSWLATELLLAAVCLALLFIAAVCCDTARSPDEVDLDGEERP